MRLVTWNVNSLRARTPLLLAVLERHAPDVVCLQETKTAPEQVPHLELVAAGYQTLDHSVGRWNGVAVLARDDVAVDDLRVGLPGEPDPTEARWVEVTVAGVRTVSVYVPNGREPGHPMFAAKLAFLEAAAARVASLTAAGPTVLAGDWNVAPTDRDVWDRTAVANGTHVTPEERARLDAIVRGAGLTDAFRAVDDDADGFTWWDYRMGAFRRGMGMRIDLVLVSHHLAVTAAEVDTSVRRTGVAGARPSDHAPLVVDLAPAGDAGAAADEGAAAGAPR